MGMRQGLRYYILGLCMLLIAMNIPEIKTLIHDKVMIAQPAALNTLKFAYDDISVAVVPLIGQVIGKPTFMVNGKIENVDTTDDMSLAHGQSLTADQIDKILTDAGSPAIGTGQYWIDYGIKHNIDAAYVLAIFYYESGFATNQQWSGFKADTTHTFNVGNMICAGYQHCYGRFRDYSYDANPWASAIEDNTHLLAIYHTNDGINDFGKAITKWAPPEDNNNTEAYIDGAETMIRAWRNTNRIILNDDANVIKTNGVPFGDAQSVSAPITEDKNTDFGFNVQAALNANKGSLRNIIIKDGEQWSFNESVGYVPNDQLRKIVHYGDGWCDLACRYVQVFRGLGLHITHGTDISSDDIVFLQHGGISLNQCSFDESPFIWSAGQKGFNDGMQDLIINNRTGKTIRIAVVDNTDATATIVGKLE